MIISNSGQFVESFGGVTVSFKEEGEEEKSPTKLKKKKSLFERSFFDN